jgi:hypothetical protein
VASFAGGDEDGEDRGSPVKRRQFLEQRRR